MNANGRSCGKASKAPEVQVPKQEVTKWWKHVRELLKIGVYMKPTQCDSGSGGAGPTSRNVGPSVNRYTNRMMNDQVESKVGLNEPWGRNLDSCVAALSGSFSSTTTGCGVRFGIQG